MKPVAEDKPAIQPGTETIVMVRHGEKPMPEARGQLSCQGLNRALSLPTVLARFGKPAAIFAADPASETTEGNPLPWATKYSYVRPLATIEPYAIAWGMPVNAQIAAGDIRDLQRELLKPELSHALVVVAWEHLEARKFAEQMLTAFGLSQIVPSWENSDYETIYVFRITDGKSNRKLTFSVEHEDLGSLPTACFTVPPANKPAETKPAIAPVGAAAPQSPAQKPDAPPAQQ